jgi:hypothetical protein
MFVICGDKTTFFIRCLSFVARQDRGCILTQGKKSSAAG